MLWWEAYRWIGIDRDRNRAVFPADVIPHNRCHSPILSSAWTEIEWLTTHFDKLGPSILWSSFWIDRSWRWSLKPYQLTEDGRMEMERFRIPFCWSPFFFFFPTGTSIPFWILSDFYLLISTFFHLIYQPTTLFSRHSIPFLNHGHYWKSEQKRREEQRYDEWKSSKSYERFQKPLWWED